MSRLQNLLFTHVFYHKRYLTSNKMSRIADLSCKIMRKFLFPTYSTVSIFSYYTRFTPIQRNAKHVGKFLKVLIWKSLFKLL